MGRLHGLAVQHYVAPDVRVVPRTEEGTMSNTEPTYTFPDAPDESISFGQLVESCVRMKGELITAYQIIDAMQQTMKQIADVVNQHTELFHLLSQGIEQAKSAAPQPDRPLPGQYL